VLVVARLHQISGTFSKQISTNRVPDVGRQHGKLNGDVIRLVAVFIDKLNSLGVHEKILRGKN